MASWGAYFSSYVKKKEDTPLPPTPDTNDGKSLLTKPKPLAMGTSVTPAANKLYGAPVDLATDPPMPKSNSNAARVAKLFGYANANSDSTGAPETTARPAFANVASKLVEAVRAEKKADIAKQDYTPKPLSPIKSAIPANAFENVLVGKEPVIQKIPTEAAVVEMSVAPLTARPRPPIRTRKSTKSSISGLDALMEELVAGEPVVKAAQPAPLASVVKSRPSFPRWKKGSLSDLDALMNELGGGESIDLPKPASEATRPTRTKQGSSSSLDALMDELSGFGQTTPAPLSLPKPPRTPSLASLPRLVTALNPAPTSQAGSAISSIPRSVPTSTPLSAQSRDDYFSYRNMSSSPEPILSSMSEFSSMKPSYMTQSPVSMISRQDSFASRSSFGSRRKDSLTSRSSSVSRTSDLSSIIEPVLSEEDQLRLRQRVLESERQEEQLRKEKEQRALEHEQMLNYEKQQEKILYEREVMEEQRQRMIEQEAMFQQEAKRLEEEEEQMKLFILDVEMERQKEEKEEEEQERFRREAIEEMEREQERQQAEIDDEERRREALEEAERERERQREEMEEERRRREDIEEMEREREEQELRDQRRIRQAEKKRRAKEEADRLAAQAREYEEEIEAERLRFEAEEEEMEQERMRAEEEEARRQEAEEERRRLEEEFEKREAQRAKEQRIAMQRKAAQDRAERERARAQQQQQMQNEDAEDSEPEVLTKEQQMAKAEEKIRAAFAGLAKEKEQISNGPREPLRGRASERDNRPTPPVKNFANGIKPAGRDSRIDTEEGRGVARNNTVAVRPMASQVQPLGLSRGNTVGGLPSGPRGGGLPRGPRAGLPSGPRQR